MRVRPAHDEKGMTLAELLISMGIFMVVLLGVYQVFDVHHALFASGEGRVDVQHSARYTMSQMATQIRMTGYYPENFDANTANNLVNPVAIQAATESALAIFGDVNGSGSTGVFLFCLNGTSLMRATTFACNTGQVLARNITSLRFAYYNATNDPIPNPLTATYQLDGQDEVGVPDLTNTTQRGAVRRIVITLTATETVGANTPGQDSQIYTLTSDVRLRNLN